jgi:1-acyl-sn-glycerol-3-phosphate acyltransferase
MSAAEKPIPCAALTQAGLPCKNRALSGSSYCRIHQPADASAPKQAEAARAPDAVGSFVVSTADTEADAAPDADLRAQLIEELNRLIERVKALAPDGMPASASDDPSEVLSEGAGHQIPELGRNVVERLRRSPVGDFLDIETYKGLWFLVNYTVQSQLDVIKRHRSGDYETDEWGLDMDFVNAVLPFLTFMYKSYWRVETSGMDNVPVEGRGLLVSNHSGTLPWDGAMIATAVYHEHPMNRLVRSLYASWFPTLPFVSEVLAKGGQVLANVENGTRLLEQDHLVAVFPEGYKGVGKLFKERYQLARFGRGGFVRMALASRAPIIPVSVVGAEETYIIVHKSRTVARLIGFPFFPISITWPWLGPLGFIPLPTKWSIDFGTPIPTEQYGPDAANNLALVSQLTDQVRNIVQEMVYARLSRRHSVFLG